MWHKRRSFGASCLHCTNPSVLLPDSVCTRRVILAIVLHKRILCLASRPLIHYCQYVSAACMAIHHLLQLLHITLIVRLKLGITTCPRVTHGLTNAKAISIKKTKKEKKKDRCLYLVKPFAFGLKTLTTRQWGIWIQFPLPV